MAEHTLSLCCDSPVRIAHGKAGKWPVCRKCGKPCNTRMYDDEILEMWGIDNSKDKGVE